MDRAAAIALLESKHTFPGDHGFHVIVRQQPEDVAGVSRALAELAGLADLSGRVSHHPSKQGTYVSLRVSLPCASAAQVLDVYARLATLPAVIRYF